MSAEPCKGPSLLERLNDDVLTLILYESVAEDPCAVTTLSLTSKRLRSVCLPTLFEKATLDCGRLPDSEPPNVAWPYIRTMDITGSFTTSQNFDAGSLRQIIPRLTALRVIRFVHFQWGVTWDSLQSVLAAPNVHVLEIEEPFSAWRQTFTIPDGGQSHFCLTEFVYTGHYPQPPRESYRMAMRKESDPVHNWCYLNALILSLHQTLEVLRVPSVMAPLPVMATVEWPRLRELTLDGDNYYGDESALFSRLCARMPRLRVLDLHLRHKFHSQTIVWPSGVPLTPSFGNLKKVFLPYPDPNDSFYLHLPSTLQHLHLVDRPRYYHFKAERQDVLNMYARPDLITATDLLRTLKQLQGAFTSLQVLEVAFEVDGHERALVDHIVTAFPNLQLLQLHWYRPAGGSASDIESTVRSISQNLSALHSLRHFRTYFNPCEDDDTVTYAGERRLRRSLTL
ncbi:hypothetical protein EVG20_g6930 [Dentipellis fragilis]|uniref:F-box domain-containing protein n=1 Tax=Dentipellis fragilis TaxID=205917 RepID=A0A4Y9YGT1_9AGAM|nr:hypothetical protein EVG20_g6930 [Dentipellis fragilis]